MSSAHFPKVTFRRFCAALAALGLVVTASWLQMGPAAAVDATGPGPVAPRTDVTADSLPTVQINGVVWKTLIVGDTVFAGGEFTTARPAGAAAGTSTVPRSNLLAFNVRTGVLDATFAPTFNAKVKTLAVSPDGKRLYVGGAFTTVNGLTRNRIAAFDIATGALVTTFAPSFNSSVNAIQVTASAVYVGGLFYKVGTVARPSLAAVRPSDGALLSWAPVTDGMVQALTLTPDQTRLVVGGNFATVNGASAKGLASVSTADGSLYSFAINQVVENYGDTASILFLEADADGNIFGGGYAYGGPTHFFEGLFSANAYTGQINWLADCHGDTYSTARVGQTVYSTSHHHFCGNIGGFPDTNPRKFWQHANAFTVDATGTVLHDSQGYPDFYGQPAPSLVNWFPDVPSGTYTGQSQAGWTMASTSEYLVMGGEFPSVNGTRQEGLARFAVPALATNKQGPRLSGTEFQPSLLAITPNKVRVKWPSNWDRDDLTLKYELFREGLATAVSTSNVQSTFWSLPSQSYDDTTVVPGQVYRYRVRATDPSGNLVTSAWISITVPTSVSAYQTQVLNSGPSHYWRMGAPGTWADYAGASDLTSTGTVVTDSAGAVNGDSDPASAFDGSTGTSSSQLLEPGPNLFTAEAWFKTTSTSGGKVIGFGNSNSGLSGSYDRHVYLDNAGHVVFGVYPGGVRTVASANAYNDGQWHQVAASLSPAGMKLWVDGMQVGSRTDTTVGQDYSGYWRVGGDNLGGWVNQPSSNLLAGSIDEVAVYPTALTTDQIRTHYTATGRTLNVPPLPTDAYAQAVNADAPTFFWRLADTNAVAADSSGNEATGTYFNGVTQGVASTVAPNAAAGFDGVDDTVSSAVTYSDPEVYSVEAWFKTTTISGGKIVGFGNQPSGNSSNYDRHIYMDPGGHVNFGVWTGNANIITSGGLYNNGSWHHVVATQNASGMALMIDGKLVGTNANNVAQPYSGYWRVGGDTSWNGNAFFTGTIDEVAVYDHAITLAQVRSHYRASGAAATNEAPSAGFTSGCTDGTCDFVATASDPDGSVTGYAWDFGDGVNGSGAAPQHVYGHTGTYTVTLAVTDDQGATTVLTNDVSVVVPVVNAPPTAAFTVGTPVGLTASFDGSGSTDTDGTVASYAWDFGDGTTGTGATPSHTYAAGGTYHVSLTVTDNAGATSASVTHDVTVTGPNAKPTASFTFSANGRKVSVDGSGSTDPDGTVDSYAWDYGDGTTGTGETASHTYSSDGTRTITLVVTDNKGTQSDAVTQQVTVTNAKPTASFTATAAGLKVSVDASASADSDGTVASYAWDYGDGTTGTGNTASHTYASAGGKTITLLVTDNNGAVSDASVDTVTVTNTKPTAAFTTSVTGLKVSVDGSGSADSDGTVASYAWDYGDGATGTGATDSHTYSTGGAKTVTLVVTDNAGGTDALSKTVTISANVVADDFGRTVTRWGTADTGGTWTYSNGGYYSTNGSVGVITLPTAGSQGSANLDGAQSLNTNTTFTLKADAVATGGGAQHTTLVRRNGTSDYRFTVTFAADNTVRLNLTKRVSGTTTNLGDVKVSGLTYAAGDTLSVRFVATGQGTTALQGKVWKQGTTEPSTAQLSRTDATAALQVTGGFGFIDYVSATSTAVPVVLRVDSLRVVS